MAIGTASAIPTGRVKVAITASALARSGLRSATSASAPKA